MSIQQHLFFTVRSPSKSSTTLPNCISKKFQSTDTFITSKENIRERLNMHVKKRIQEHDFMPQSTIPQTTLSFYSNPTTSTTFTQNHHPFLMSGTSAQVPPVVVLTNSLVSVESNNAGRKIPKIERTSTKMKQQRKKITKQNNKNGGNKKKIMQIDPNQQPENLIINTKFSDDSINLHDKSCENLLFLGCPSPKVDATAPNETMYDNKLKNTPDILTTVLSFKKNSLMHDPYVIQFLSSIR